jgi:hypothetical protein
MIGVTFAVVSVDRELNRSKGFVLFKSFTF